MAVTCNPWVKSLPGSIEQDGADLIGQFVGHAYRRRPGYRAASAALGGTPSGRALATWLR